jgi:DNA-directed RNA polymerase subunit F
MSDEDLAYILYSSIDFTENFNPKDPSNIRKVILDLQSIQCYDLAVAVEEIFVDAGII